MDGDDIPTTTDIEVTTTTMTTTSTPKDESCVGRAIEGSNGILQLHPHHEDQVYNFTGSFDSKYCYWNITVPEGKVVHLNFLNVKV